MISITRPTGISPSTADRLFNLLGITTTWYVVVILSPEWLGLPRALHLLLYAAAVGAYLVHHAACSANPPPTRSARGILFAPFGRVRRIPEGMPLMSGKRYYFHPSEAHEPMVVWVGWWNCRTFPGDDAAQEYHFIDRRSTRYAIPAGDLLRVA